MWLRHFIVITGNPSLTELLIIAKVRRITQNGMAGVSFPLNATLLPEVVLTFSRTHQADVNVKNYDGLSAADVNLLMLLNLSLSYHMGYFHFHLCALSSERISCRSQEEERK